MLRFSGLSYLRLAGLAALTLSCAPLALSAAKAAPAATIVIDANTGDVLQQSAADAPRFPASVTKVMTLYLLFEEMERGRFNLSSPLKVSTFASRQAPSKLGVKAGSEINVKDAILALVTRSANDVAVVIAENIAGSQDAFARMMTQKARQIGMKNTVYKNASGLPDPQQRTTARDLALLGRAVYERFPDNARFFSTRAYNYRGTTIRGHNRLLGRVRGVDGIKTGYTRASGFNLLTSARVDGRHIVAVVMGGATGGQRDNKMAALVNAYLPRASTKKVVDKQLMARIFNSTSKPVAVATNERAKKTKSLDTETFAQAATSVTLAARGAPLALAPMPAIRPTETERPQNTFVALITPALNSVPDDKPVAAAPKMTAREQVSDGMKWRIGAQARKSDRDTQEIVQEVVTASVTLSEVENAAPALTMTDAQATTSGWIVQIAAAGSETAALKMLGEAKGKLKNKLANAKPFTERVVKGNATMYRARFSGFEDQKMAENACTALKGAAYNCLTIRL